jgi:hypothetical protein
LPRNGSGTFQGPPSSVNPAVAGTTIDSSAWNTLLADIETALSESIARDGQTATTAAIPFAGGGIKTDIIAENGANNGVTVDGLLIKDGGIADDVAFTQQVLLTGIISPSQITANQDDYSPTGFATASTLRLSTDASRNLTSVAGGVAGRLIIVHNVGAFPLVVKDDDGSTGTAANRFALAGDITLGADQSAKFQYDGTSSRWRMVAGPVSGAITSSGLTMATDRLLGRDTASTGAIEELSVTAPLSITGGAITVGAATDSASGVVELATTAEVEAGSDPTRVPPVNTLQRHPSACKAWVKFDNAAVSAAAYNVSSIVDGGSASWSPQWDTDFSSVNYSVFTSIAYTSGNFNRMSAIRTQVAGAVTIETFSTGGNDESNVGSIYTGAFGDQ